MYFPSVQATPHSHTDLAPSNLYQSDLKGAAGEQRRDAAWPGLGFPIVKKDVGKAALGLQKLDLQRTA